MIFIKNIDFLPIFNTFLAKIGVLEKYDEKWSIFDDF